MSREQGAGSSGSGKEEVRSAAGCELEGRVCTSLCVEQRNGQERGACVCAHCTYMAGGQMSTVYEDKR